MFRFASPLALLLIPVVIAASWLWMRRRASGDARIALPRASEQLPKMGSLWLLIDKTLPWVRALALILMVVALARPQSSSSIESVSSFGVDIVVALDNSASMRAEDFVPANRLGEAKRVVREFIKLRPEDRVALVAFASHAATRCPLTQDHEMLDAFVDALGFAPEDQSRTAIGLGLATAVNRLRQSDSKSRVVILLTDGENNSGEIGPKAASEAAKALGVRVYTVGVGSKGRVPYPVMTRGGRKVYEQVLFNLDEELLTEIANDTGGQYFRASDSDALENIFATIDSLEKTKIESNVRVIYSEMFLMFLAVGLGLFLFERLLLSTRLRRIP